ncbi:nicotinamide riboside transporter PnuC [Spiroplasma endosymbiont of Zeiraphera isertana]|uniref:nicotinamide riboside transporter PnuC n=1 Tax=Spiroplasma endosymbiont of Zeiraphera isertana TaxID=3066313 RepID=UPI00313F2CD0
MNHFINPNLYPSVWTIVNRQAYHPWQQVLLFLNGIAAFTNVICIILISFGKISNFFWGFFAVSIYGCIALVWDYVGDMQLNLFFFLPFQFIGYSSVFFYFEIPEFSRVILGKYDFDGNTFQQVLPHILDSLTNSLSIVAQILMLLRFREQWIFWIIVNIFQIAMYSGVAHNRLDVNLLLMWIVALGNSGFGFYQWFFVRSKEKVVVKKETYEQ